MTSPTDLIPTPRATFSSSRSTRVTANPSVAIFCAMPLPILPAPTTARRSKGRSEAFACGVEGVDIGVSTVSVVRGEAWSEAAEPLPDDLARLLAVVGGWAVYSGEALRFPTPAEVASERALWDGFVSEFEEGSSDNWSHALWRRGWLPLAHNSFLQWAYAPEPCFGGRFSVRR